MTPSQSKIGQTFRHIGTSFRSSLWVLTSIFTGANGIKHGHLTSAGDAARRKTIALSVITDPRPFVAVVAPEAPK